MSSSRYHIHTELAAHPPGGYPADFLIAEGDAITLDADGATLGAAVVAIGWNFANVGMRSISEMRGRSDLLVYLD